MKSKFTKKELAKSSGTIIDTIDNFLSKVPIKHINEISEHSLEFLEKAKEQYTKKNMEWPGNQEFLEIMFKEGMQTMLGETLIHLVTLDIMITNNKKK